MNDKMLVQKAMEVRENSYAPYSGFAVGAALLCADGTVFTGCNVESAAYAPTVCAERTAFVKAVSEGQREFVTIAIVGGKVDGALDACYPCGVCRQVMAEFCCEDFRILMATSANDWAEETLGALLPNRFGPDNLR